MKAVCRGRNDMLRFVDQVTAKLGQDFEKPYSVVIKRFVRFRTLDQNKKLHVLFRSFAEQAGYSESEIKDLFKQQYGPTKTIAVADVRRNIPKGTSEYNVGEMSMMIEHVYRVAAEMGFTLSEDDG